MSATSSLTIRALRASNIFSIPNFPPPKLTIPPRIAYGWISSYYHTVEVTSLDMKIQKRRRNCYICEAVCGLQFEIENGQIIAIQGDKNDPLSQGYLCPKGVAIKDMYTDPDRLRHPVKRIGSKWQEITWDEALDYAADGLVNVQKQFGDDAVANYFGNAYGSVYGIVTHMGYLRDALGSRNNASLASIDHISHLMTSAAMYGHQFLLPVPDLDRTEYLVVAGANPLASNGSLMTAPRVRERLKAVRDRGGKIIVIDPRRTETAKLADDHIYIRPGTDAAFAAAILNTLFEQKLADPRSLSEMLNGMHNVAKALATFSPERTAAVTGIEPQVTRKLARDFAASKRAVWYGRVGTCAQKFGAITQWLFSLINVVTGNLDHPGGFMWTTPAVDLTADPNSDRGSYGEWHTRLRGLPSFGGEVPAVTFAEEMLTEGDGQIRGFVNVAGNPVLSFPNGPLVDKALASLEFMVALDPYINATSRHANVILPAPNAIYCDHYELVFYTFAVRNVAKFTGPVLPPPEGAMTDWEIMVALGQRISERKGKPVMPTMSPAEMIDQALQQGRYGKAMGHPLELSLDKLKQHPSGIDLGPLEPRLPECLRTPDHKIRCDPPEQMSDLQRLEMELFDNDNESELVLIGRRQVRSKNTQTQNCQRLMRGPNLCLLFMHPDDLAARQLNDGQQVQVASKIGAITLPVKATEDIMPGVVSIPHGFDHGRPGTHLHVASGHPGASVNDLTDDTQIDTLTGMPSFNGLAVTVGPAPVPPSLEPRIESTELVWVES